MYLADLRREVENLFENRGVRFVFKAVLLPLFFLIKLFLFIFKRDRLTIDHLEIVVGSRCSLHCRKCANLMQYYEHPVMFPVEQIKEDLYKLLSLDVVLQCVHLIGGEPLLYKGLPELISLLQDSPKVKSIRIITNGTIIPAEPWLKYLTLPKVHILISNYINIGVKTNEVFQFLKNNGADVRLTMSPWYNYHHNFSGYDRSVDELKHIYHSCNVACHEMLNGEIHLCPTSAHGMFLGLILRDESSFVSIRHNGTKTDKRAVLNRLRYLLHSKIPNACEYCSGDSGEIIPVAEQLPVGSWLDSAGKVCHRSQAAE